MNLIMQLLKKTGFFGGLSDVEVFLKKIDLFKSLSDRDLSSVVGAITRSEFPSGSVIIREGEIGNEMYILLQGSVQVYTTKNGQDVNIAKLEKGAYFGEQALITEQRRNASIRAVSDVMLLELQKDDFLRVLSPDIKKELMRAGEKQARQKSTESAKPQYNPELTASFRAEHMKILDLYDQTVRAADERRYSEVITKVMQFKSLFKRHLADQFNNLYIYLEFYGRNRSAEDAATIRDFRMEMSSIASTVTGTIARYDEGLDEEHIESFVKDFSGLGELLRQRFEKEERALFPMYDHYGSQ